MANFIPEDKISEIKHSADIADIVSDVVLLKKAGKNLVGLCPFHSEKTPSFTVSPDKQIFYCFGCGTGGNVFTFLMKHEGVTFPEAVILLARRYGIEIPTTRPSAQQRRQMSERERLLEINTQALEFFCQTLSTRDTGKKAMAYLGQRGITQKTIHDFFLGYAPDGWDHLINFFSGKRISLGLVEKSGLIVAKKNGNGFYDRFRDRIIFPIFNINMQVIGFGGRVMDDSLPKYLNSPETPLYNKSRSLYGIQRAKDPCRKAGIVYIVEGYLDLLALHQNGIQNSVATLGTALTAEHIRLLSRYAKQMVLVYDSDEAGIRSAQRCITTFWKEHVDFRRDDVFREEHADTHILILPSGHDPDSYLFEYGPEAFLDAASRAPGIITFLIDCAIAKHGLSIEGKLRIITELQERLAAINDPIARSLYIKQLAERIDIPEATILEKIREVASEITSEDRRKALSSVHAGKSPTAGSSEALGAKAILEVGTRLEQQIVAMMLQFPEILPEIARRRVLEYFENDVLRSLGEIILEHQMDSADRLSDIVSVVDDPDKIKLLTALAMTDESWTLRGCRLLLAKFVDTSRRRRHRKLLKEQIKDAEKNNDQKLLIKLLTEKQKLAVQSERQKMALLRDESCEH